MIYRPHHERIAILLLVVGTPFMSVIIFRFFDPSDFYFQAGTVTIKLWI